ncbi:hypothetical protein GCM10023339_27130 [Alloalcanivorax gelatiniphagus]
MTADIGPRAGGDVRADYSVLPARVRLDETITSLDAAPLPDPHAGRNVDQHLALRDD